MSDAGLWKLLLSGVGLKVWTMCFLIDQDERDLVVEWPLHEGVKFTLHDHKEQREVCVVPHTITIQIRVDAQFVAISSSVEWWAVDRGDSLFNSVSSSSGDIGDPPKKGSIMRSGKPEITL